RLQGGADRRDDACRARGDRTDAGPHRAVCTRTLPHRLARLRARRGGRLALIRELLVDGARRRLRGLRGRFRVPRAEVVAGKVDPAERTRECGLQTAAADGRVGKTALPALHEHLGDHRVCRGKYATDVGPEPRAYFVVVESREGPGAAGRGVDHEAAAGEARSCTRTE